MLRIAQEKGALSAVYPVLDAIIAQEEGALTAVHPALDATAQEENQPVKLSTPKVYTQHNAQRMSY